MVDTETILELAPHYVVMLIAAFVAAALLRIVLGGVHLVVEFAVILVIVFFYPFVARRLGVAPSHWQ